MPSFTSLVCEHCGFPILGPGTCPNCGSYTIGTRQSFVEGIGGSSPAFGWGTIFLTFLIGVLLGPSIVEGVRKAAKEIEKR